jgi:beta-lactamase class A
MRRREFVSLSAVSTLVVFSSSAQTSRPEIAPLARLKQNIERISRSVYAKWGIYLKCLETGEAIAINADQQMETMSVIKIPLMVEVFRQIDAGKFALEDRVTLRDEDKLPGTGVIQSLDSGIAFTIHDLLMLMIIVSDNTATDLLFHKVGGMDAVNALAKDYGLGQTRATGFAKEWFAALRAAPSAEEFYRRGEHPFGLSSPRDIGTLLERIKTGKAVSEQASAQMMGMLRRQVYRTRLPKYVEGFGVAHKTGDFLPFVGNDVGVFESRQRNVIVSVFTGSHFGSGAYLEEAIARIGEQISNYFAYRA